MGVYYAAIFSEEEGGYRAEFPDLPGCLTQAETLDELDAMMRDALFVYLDACREDGDEIPQPQKFADLLDELAEKKNFIGLSLVSAPDAVKRVRVNVSFTETDLAIIDSAAAAKSMDRSAFLSAAAKEVASAKR